MMATKMRRRTKIYWISLGIYSLVLVVAVAVGLKITWSYAEEYENARPNKVIEEYVANLSENLWDDSIAETISAMPHEVQTDDEVAECVKDLLKNGITYQRQGTSDFGTVVKYNLLCNGNVFGKISLIEDESLADTVKFGMLPWKLYKEEFDFNGLYTSMEIVVPRTYSVYLNDVELSSEYIVEEGIHYDVLDSYYGEYVDLPTKVKYKFDNIIGTVEQSVKNEKGELVVIDDTKDDSQYITQCSEEQLARLSEFAAAFCDRYLSYTAGIYDPTYGYERLMNYIKLGSDLDVRMKQAMDGLTYSHTSTFRLDSSTLNGALELGDGFFMCDITAVTTIFYSGKGEVENTNNMKLIVVDNNDDIRAISLELY